MRVSTFTTEKVLLKRIAIQRNKVVQNHVSHWARGLHARDSSLARETS